MVDKNRFTDKMIGKSDKELTQIIESDDYEEDAKQAAQLEIDNRKNSTSDYLIKNRKQREELKDISIRLKHTNYQYRWNRFLGAGLGLLVIAIIIYFPKLITRETNLSKISGRIETVKVSIITEKGTPLLDNESNHQVAKLMFTLADRNQLYSISKDIGHMRSFPEYDLLEKRLKSSDSVFVWIENTALDKPSAQIFQLKIDNRTYINFEENRSNDSSSFFILFSIGIIMILLYFRIKYPEKFNAFFTLRR